MAVFRVYNSKGYFLSEDFYFRNLAMITFFVSLLFSATLGGASKIEVACLDGLKLIQIGEDVSLTCSFSYSDARAISWLKQTPGENHVLITSSFYSGPRFHNDFEKIGRFNASKEKSSFTLSISNAEASDSATYICAVAYYSDVVLSDCTVLVLKGSPLHHSVVLQHRISDPAQLGGNATLQCSILTSNSVEDHSVYWFRSGSTESHPEIIYSHGNRSGQCEKSSETASLTQSCVYKLPKKNISLSDAGTYYCAVAACGEILFGNGTTLNVIENRFVDPIIVALAASNILFMVVVYILYQKLHNSQHKDPAGGHPIQVNQTEDNDDLKYAALSFTQPTSSIRSKVKNSDNQPVYAHVKIHQ